MAEEFQALLDRINEQGLKKAEAEGERIVAEAKEQAAKIVADAKSQAADIVKEAERSAEIMVQKGEQSLKQSARSVMLDLRASMEKRVSQAVAGLVKETLDANGLAAVVAAVCKGYVESNGSNDDLQVLLDAHQYAQLEGAVKAALGADLQKNVELTPTDKIRGGFRLVFKGTDVMYDFSDQALAEAISQHVSANIASVISE